MRRYPKSSSMHRFRELKSELEIDLKGTVKRADKVSDLKNDLAFGLRSQNSPLKIIRIE